jgi:Glycosyltransferase
MRREQIELVEGSSVNIQAALAARLVGAAVVWRLADVSAPMLLRRAIGLLLPDLADVILVNGHATVPEYPGLSRAAGRVTVYYPMIDDAAFEDAQVIVPRQPGTLVIGMVANINPDKGIDVFVEAAGLLARRAELRFILVGAEHDTHREYARRIHERVRQLGIESRFEFTGERSDIASLMRGMDVFVISSNREGSTTTAIEAMASCLPIVATNVGAVGEVVADRETGLLVPPADPRAMATAVEALADDERLRTSLAVAGRKRFDGHFAVPVVLAKRALVYRRAAARGHGHGSR